MYVKGKMRLVYMKELILFSCELVQTAIRIIHNKHFLIICYSIYICLLWKYLWLTVGPDTVIVIILLLFLEISMVGYTMIVIICFC